MHNKHNVCVCGGVGYRYLSDRTCEFVWEIMESNQENYALADLKRQLPGYIKIQGKPLLAFSLHLI